MFNYKTNEMQQNNSLTIARAFKKRYDECLQANASGDENKLSFLIGDLSSLISSQELQIQWGLLPGYNLFITMERPNKFRASLISPDLETIDQFALKTQLEVMLEKVVTPDQAQKEAIQTVWEMLVEMGFDAEVARLAVAEADNNIEKAIELAIPFEAKIRAENVLADHANAGKLEQGLQAYYKARLEHLTSFCLLCDNVVANPDSRKSCVCSRYLCEWQFKQIGLVPTSSIVKPRPVQGLPPAFNIISVAAGEDHSVACFNNGDVYSWGRGDRGQLGDGLVRSSSFAVQLQASCKFRKVAAGNGFTLGLSTEGDLWVWGSGQAELGLNRMEETIVPKPARIVVLCPDDEYRHVQFQDISVADRLCFAIAKDNTVYVWGEQFDMVCYVPSVIPQLKARSINAHYAHPVCVDTDGKILIWNSKYMFMRTEEDSRCNATSQPKDYSTAFIYGNVCFAYTTTSTSVFEYSLTRHNNRHVLKQRQEHLGLTHYAVGTSFAVFADKGAVRVVGTGSGVMCSDDTISSPSGVEISQVRNAQLLAAGPHHVVCVAMNDRIVHGQSEQDAARDVFVYQWGRDHSVQVKVDCQADVRRQNELRWAQLADEAAVISKEKKKLRIKLECEPVDETVSTVRNEVQATIDFLNENYPHGFDMPHEGPFESGEDLEQWNEQFVQRQQQHAVIENNDNGLPAVSAEEVEQGQHSKALDVLNKCYEMSDELAIKIDDEKLQLVVDLNHPALLVNKILDDQSNFKDLNIDINAVDRDGNTALMLAMKKNDYELFTKILDLNPDVDGVFNNNFEFPLDIAVSCGGSYSKAFVVSLVEKGATDFSSLNKDKIVSIVSCAAEFMPKLHAKLALLKDSFLCL